MQRHWQCCVLTLTKECLPHLETHAKQQRMTDLWQIVGIVSKASALETNGKQFLFVGPHSTSSWTSTRQTLHLTKSGNELAAESSETGAWDNTQLQRIQTARLPCVATMAAEVMSWLWNLHSTLQLLSLITGSLATLLLHVATSHPRAPAVQHLLAS